MRSLSVGPRLGVRSGLRGRAWLSSPVARKVLALGAALLLGSNPLLTGLIVPNVEAASPSFVTRQGQQLTLDGQPFRFTGMNIYAANSDGWCGEDYTANQLRTAFDGIGSRNTVLRAWFFQTMAAHKGPDGSWSGVRDWSHFDQTLAVAAEKGVHVVVTLTDQWGECGDGGISGFKTKDWYLGGYNVPDPVLAAKYAQWVSYRDWVTEVVTRYRNDPTILAWQLVNEAEVKDSLNAGCPVGDPNDPMDHGNILRDFAQDISGLVRGIDPNHLISLGTLGGGQCGTQDWQYSLVHALPNIDLCEVHDYSLVTMPGDQWNGLQRRLDQCAALDKPLFIGETGITPNNLADQSFEARAKLFDAKFRTQFGTGVVGELVWAYRRTGSTLNTYDIGDGDPTLLRLMAWSPGCTWRPDESPPVACGPRRDTRLDPSFGINGKVVTYSGAPSIADYFASVIVQPDGRIVAGGQAYRTDRDLLLARFNADGTADTSFAAGGRRVDSFTAAGEIVMDLAVQPDGRIVAVGHAERTVPERSVDFLVARYNPDGSLDASFGDQGVVFTDFRRHVNNYAADYATSVLIYADGRILVGGYSGSINDDVAMARYLQDGTLDTTFGVNGKMVNDFGSVERLSKVILEPDGRINAIGSESDNMAVMRYTADGALDVGYGSGGRTVLAIAGGGYSHGAARGPDGSIVVAGYVQYDIANDLAAYAVSRVDAAGSIDTSFGTNGRVVTQIGPVNDIAQDLRLQSDGRILVAGFADSGTIQSSDHDIGLIRYDADGSLDQTFGSGGIVVTDLGLSNDVAYAITLQSDGRAIAVGNSSTQAGFGSSFVTRYIAGPPLAAPTLPTVPTDVSAVAGNAQASVRWRAVLDGGSPITGFTVTASPGGAQTTFPSGQSGLMTGLTNGTEYTFTVKASNAVGSSAASAPSNPVTPISAAPPDAPGNVAGVAGDGEVTLTWDAAADNGEPVTGYTVRTINTSGPALPYPLVSTTATSTTIGGLANGESYRFTVQAANVLGASPSSSPVVVTPAGSANAPSAPRWVFAAATGDNDGACVDWDPPTFDAGGVREYHVAASNGESLTVSGSVLTACFLGTLPNGSSYEFQVAARGGPDLASARFGPFSTPSNPVVPPHSPPTPPKRLFAYTENGSATVSVKQPVFHGGGTVSMLTVTASPGGQTASSPIQNDWTDIKVTGLTNGTAYTFTATATNEYGTSVASAPSASVTPGTVPGSPLAVSATAGDGSAVVTWTPPASDGGRPLEYYTVTASPGGATRPVGPTVTSSTFAALENGTSYTFTVTAHNSFGDGLASEPSNAVTPISPITPPPAPTGVTAAAGDGQAVVSWTAPASDGGSPITGYTVTAAPGGATLAVVDSSTTVIIGSLTNGTSYTFTVTATNGVGTGPPSASSDPVTPQAGAPAPQTTSQTVPPEGGTATTGSGATASDPITTSVSVPPTADGGTVTIAETAVSQAAPSGYQFVGQQVDINSSALTTPSNPLTIVFTIDGSVLLAATGTATPPPAIIDITRAELGSPVVIAACNAISPSTIEPDPCVADRQYVNGDLRITILTGSASHWNTAVKAVPVTVTNNGYSPKSVIVEQGGIVLWTFAGSTPHSATENLKLGPAKAPLFNSGVLTSGRYGYLFRAAATYTYGSTVKGDPGSFAGSVAVPVGINPTSGAPATSFTITWSSATLTGYVFDVQYRFMKAGTKTWSPLKVWKTGVTSTTATFSPSTGGGTYAFSARIRNSSTGINAQWSPEATFIVR